MQSKEQLYNAIFNAQQARTKEEILEDIGAWELQIRVDEGAWQAAFARMYDDVPGILLTQGVDQAIIEMITNHFDNIRAGMAEEKKQMEEEIEAGF